MKFVQQNGQANQLGFEMYCKRDGSWFYLFQCQDLKATKIK